MKEQTMLVDCMIGDFSDPEAVSGGSTTVLLFFTTILMLIKNTTGQEGRFLMSERPEAVIGGVEEGKKKIR